MPSLPPYVHDVFVSYAHVDDQKLPEADTGWVTLLVDNLRQLLTQKLGRQENLALWMDHQLAGNVELTAAIDSAVRGSATILIIMSPGYKASRWCGSEMAMFLEAARARGNAASRVFLIEKDAVDKPAKLEDFKGYRFWRRDPHSGVPRTMGYPRPDYDSEPQYYLLLEDISYQLAQEIKRHQADPVAVPPFPDPARPDDRPTVYLAEATDDLDSVHAEFKSYLEQARVRVLPEAWYPRDPGEFRAAARADLAAAKVFVQLLSTAAGKRPRDLPEGYVGLQYALAEADDLPIMQWRSREVDVAKVTDVAHRALLESNTVTNESLVEFKKRVVQAALRPAKPAAQPQAGADRFVFVNAEQADLPLDDKIGQVFDRYQIGYALPLESEKAAEVRASLREHLLNCDAVVLVYGKTRATWVTAQLHESRKILSERSRKPLIGVLEVPPAPKDKLNVHLPYLRQIICHAGVSEVELKRFLDELATDAPPTEVPHAPANL